MALTAPDVVTPAFAGPITDQVLEQTIAVARHASNGGALTNDGAALLLFIAAPALEELLQWRRRLSVIRDMATPENVVMFPGTSA